MANGELNLGMVHITICMRLGNSRTEKLKLLLLLLNQFQDLHLKSKCDKIML